MQNICIYILETSTKCMINRRSNNSYFKNFDVKNN